MGRWREVGLTKRTVDGYALDTVGFSVSWSRIGTLVRARHGGHRRPERYSNGYEVCLESWGKVFEIWEATLLWCREEHTYLDTFTTCSGRHGDWGGAVCSQLSRQTLYLIDRKNVRASCGRDWLDGGLK